MFFPLTAIFVLLLAAPAAAGREVILVQIVHRHGARDLNWAPAPSFCGSEGCGALTDNGGAMLEALGQYMSARYVWDNWTHFDTADAALAAPPHSDFAALQSGMYSARRVRSRSSDVERCLQSAGAMLRALFPAASSLPPAIHTRPTNTDFLIISGNTVSLNIPGTVGMDVDINGWTDFTSIISAPVLRELAAELPFEIGGCFDSALETNVWVYRGCAGTIADTASVYLSMGTLSSYPNLEGNYSRLLEFVAENARRVFQYNASDADDVARGPVLYPLAQELARNMRIRGSQLASNPTPVNPAALVHHYSGHDTTMVPVAAFLGHNMGLSDPSYGQAVILELVLDTASGTKYVQGWLGAPGTMAPPPAGTPPTAAHYRYSVTSWSIGCRRDGANVMVADGTCTLDEFNAYIESIAPQTAAGSTCYLPPAVIARIDCDKPEAPTSSGCIQYRTSCPEFACPVNTAVAELTSGDLTCYSTVAVDSNGSTTSTGLRGGVVAGIAVGCAIGGVAIGAVAAALLARRLWSRTPTAKSGASNSFTA